MAERRMFAKTIIDSDAFLEMPPTAQLLYFHLCMRGDDEGFVNKPRSIMKLIGCKEDDMNVLFERKFIIPFDSGVVVIKHWKIHNYIRGDRLHPTKYTEEKALLMLSQNQSYTLCQSVDGQMSDMCQSTDCQLEGNCHTEVRLGKDSIDKGSINTICTELDKPAPCGTGIILPLNDGSVYDVPADKVQMWTETFPGVNVKAELKKMYAWLDSNPKKRKTRRGVEKFIYGWLERAQNSGRGQSGREPLNNYAEGMKGWMEQNE